MRFSGLVALFAAASSSLVSAGSSDTTTLTSTRTKTMTVTMCHPTVTNCPYRQHTTTTTPTMVNTTMACNSTSTSFKWSVSNATHSVGPTGTGSTIVTAKPTVPATTLPISGPSSVAPAPPPAHTTGAAAGLAVQGGVLAAAVGAAVAALF